MTDRQALTSEQLKIVIVGHVDHGKSTVVGRLLHETGSLPEGKIEQVQQSCKRRGMQFEWAFLMDALQAERDQEITIDSSQIWFRTALRRYVLIDAPGHKEFLKNMISGASQAEAALLIISADEGVREQSRRHGYLLSMLGVRQTAVLVNKMDLVGYSEERFRAIQKEYTAYLNEIGLTAKAFVPAAARDGVNVAARADEMPWYSGPTLTELLDSFVNAEADDALPLRMPLQDIYRFDGHKRILAGRIESGKIRKGDVVLFSPSNKRSKVASVEVWNTTEEVTEAGAGMSAGVTLEEQIFVERGEIISHVERAPVLTNLFRARLFWLADKPLETGKQYALHIATKRYAAEIRSVEKVIDTGDLSEPAVKTVRKDSAAEVVVHVRGLAAADEFRDLPRTGRFMLTDGFKTIAGGNIRLEGFQDQRVTEDHTIIENEGTVTSQTRESANGHRGAVIWITGASHGINDEVAAALERRLFASGMHAFLLHHERLNAGLCSGTEGLEFIRRAAAAAALFAESGCIAVVPVISGVAADRRIARSYAPGMFHSVHVKTIGEEAIGYEPPANADLILNVTDMTNAASAAEKLEDYVRRFASLKEAGRASFGEGI